MLTHLYIKNYALIDELDIDLHPGFSVITGETGAGKSIILGAIGLLLGQRADVRDIQQGARKCTIEAQFCLKGFGLEEYFTENDFDFENQECSIRRELTDSGKSRAFVNDTPATLAQLKVLGARIIDIHSQHQNLMLADEGFQTDMLDLMGNAMDQRQAYATCYRRHQQLRQQLAALRQEAEEAGRNHDYLDFQWQQLNQLKPQPGEDETLEKEAQTLQHAEEIKTVLYQTGELLSTEEGGILTGLRHACQQLQQLQRVYDGCGDWAGRLENAYIDLKDLCDDVSSQAERMEYNPERLQEVTQRLDALYTLEQKHHVENAAQLALLAEEMRRQLDKTEQFGDLIAQAEAEEAACRQELESLGQILTARRNEAARRIEAELAEALVPLGIPHPQVRIDIAPLPQPSPLGMDRVTLMFSANRNSTPSPIAEVASGGEIARVMLAVKRMLASVKQMPTIIFDEIDTGVSGRIAECMAHIMRQMSRDHGTQVVSITHLPQIAARGDVHYKVYKQDNDSHTASHIVRLSDDERVTEIAHMLSGAEVTEAAIENAKQLLRK
ncbi:MAG: DNA repair protein RecN [Bacteroidaceae bacterium]